MDVLRRVSITYSSSGIQCATLVENAVTSHEREQEDEIMTTTNWAVVICDTVYQVITMTVSISWSPDYPYNVIP